MRILTLALNGFRAIQGFRGLQGFDLGNTNETDGWNSLLAPDRFSHKELGGNWIDPDLLGPLGVGNLSAVPGVVNNTLDNRHIPEALHSVLCGHAFSDNETAAFRDYFSVLIELAWPKNAELKVCCSEAAGASATSACQTPDYTFSSNTPETEGLEPPAFAPHFLTEQFEKRQQEALTAMLIPKINVLGKHLELDLRGVLDLGPGTLRP
jgi:hypothetical protein